MLAFAYTTPISALICLCDREPEKTDAAKEQIEAFSRHFIKIYGMADHAKKCLKGENQHGNWDHWRKLQREIHLGEKNRGDARR